MQTDKTIVDTSLKEIKKHGTDAFPLAIYEDDFRTFENGSICWHWHKEIQFSVVVENKIRFYIGSKQVVLNEGEAIYINSSAFHQINPEYSCKGTIFSYILDLSFIESSYISEVYNDCILPFINDTDSYIILNRHETDILKEIKELYDKRDFCYQIRIKGLLCELWYEMMHGKRTNEMLLSPRQRRDNDRVKLAITYINEHYCEGITLDDIAAFAMVSKSELCRCFKRILDTTPVDYLIKHRVFEAARLLSSTDKRIIDVAHDTGFDSTSHMGRFFHRHMGCSPSDFRKD